ncbi:uncharacterized protein LDX57_012154 [Aspergillus melleus]|uniref:uncharacterized protein n=1 Tax=Aspergillus melleus TaxID=138277 RepID=UPI001E8D49E9|nr:uncharacterized protein LDX57_012154 [Aspergillus melleus]KAH8434511.1 hypothetical protein LDX57_012154 [Aspergillus melleus]
MFLTTSKPKALPFGRIHDVLFQIIINGDIDTVLTLCLVSKSTYEVIKSLEHHICGSFMRSHGITWFDPVLTLNPWTGGQNAVTVHSIRKFIERQDIAQRLAHHIVPSVWGSFSDDETSIMNLKAELQLAQRLERGLYVLFHMADIAHPTRKVKQRRFSNPVITGRLMVLSKMLDEYHHLPPHTRKAVSLENYVSHIQRVLKYGYKEADIGRRRLELRGYLDEQTQIDFHTTVRMLRELMERMLLRHGPKDYHRDTNNEFSVISWFLLKQSPQSLEKLFLGPQDDCCTFKPDSPTCSVKQCYFSDPLDDYWRAWKDVPDLGCRGCDCKRRVRSWSVKPALIDAHGREFNRAAERYLKESWTQRHVGLHRAFAMGCFNIII